MILSPKVFMRSYDHPGQRCFTIPVRHLALRPCVLSVPSVVSGSIQNVTRTPAYALVPGVSKPSTSS